MAPEGGGGEAEHEVSILARESRTLSLVHRVSSSQTFATAVKTKVKRIQISSNLE